MDKIKQEIARTDPEVPFRASSTHTHYTWAKTFQSRPELYIRPQSLEEIQKIVNLARRCRRRLVVVGSGHSPSDLTCTSSWKVNLDDYSRVLKMDKQRKTLLVQSGIRLAQLHQEARKDGLTIPNIGSIDAQSIAGAIATATHGSSLKHGLMSENVLSLQIVLSNGHAVRCSKDHNQELFRAGLVSLGAIGIVSEVEYQMVDDYNIEWQQRLVSIFDEVIPRWNKDLWSPEFTRVWWMPYMKRAVLWTGDRTDKPLRAPEESWYGGSVGFHTYHNLLWLSNYVPFILPWVEWFVFGMQHGFSLGSPPTGAVQEVTDALLMNCLYSQFVNEWALPLHKGPEAITRLSAWIHGEPGDGGIPVSSKGVWIHCPIETRVSDSTYHNTTRPFIDNTNDEGPTLYLNAIMYRPYLQDPQSKDRYYEAFEWLMRDLGGRPHYAKNFTFTTHEYVREALGDGLRKWEKVRNEVDPEGMFLGEWHKRCIGIGQSSEFPLEETEVTRKPASNGGQYWVGKVLGSGFSAVADQPRPAEKADSPSASSSGESFDVMHGAEAERSTYLNDDEEEDEHRFHGNPRDTMTGTAVFDKM